MSLVIELSEKLVWWWNTWKQIKGWTFFGCGLATKIIWSLLEIFIVASRSDSLCVVLIYPSKVSAALLNQSSTGLFQAFASGYLWCLRNLIDYLLTILYTLWGGNVSGRWPIVKGFLKDRWRSSRLVGFLKNASRISPIRLGSCWR